ncbi:hypothetical protein FBUS_01575 [Fasciolopsis buskii]|uniref:Uncharacterized protein n=1 Tax=Fasciolopsis buskii TaxID=27845 RepID=A0A8E0RLI3_9TREM|nr:hypothetical protein FBUS_01575 [Fasciolopsis buski]
MRAGRAVWLTLTAAGFTFALFFLFLCVIAMSRNEWTELVVNYQTFKPSYTYDSRSRGLWIECSTAVSGIFVGFCTKNFPWEDRSNFNKSIEPLLIIRMSTALIQLATSGATLITIIIIGAILADISRRPYKWTDRSGQYSVLISGTLMWFYATAYFISILLHFEALNAENIMYDPNFVGARSAWSPDLRDATFYQGGSMMILVYAADVLLYLSGTSFLLTASLYSPPIIERPPVKITQVA